LVESPNSPKRGERRDPSRNYSVIQNIVELLAGDGFSGLGDAHKGLNAVRKAVFISVPWQRCQFHTQQNVQTYVPKQEMKN